MYYRPRFLEKLERKLKWLAIPNLMLIVVGAMGVVIVMNYLIGMSAGQSIYSMLTFDKALIAKGQVWRVFTFLFLPPSGNVFFALIGLYFYWLIGSSLENEWGFVRIHGILPARRGRSDNLRADHRLRDERLPQHVALFSLRAAEPELHSLRVLHNPG